MLRVASNHRSDFETFFPKLKVVTRKTFFEVGLLGRVINAMGV